MQQSINLLLFSELKSSFVTTSRYKRNYKIILKYTIILYFVRQMSGKKLTNGIAIFSKDEYDNYQKYLSLRKEWPGTNINASKDSQVTLNIPVLIMELHRLVPYKDGHYINFHPFNMPYIKIRKIDLVGTVTSIKQNVNNFILTIEDGTGVINVNYKLEQYLFSLKQRNEIDAKYRQQVKDLRTDIKRPLMNCPKKFPAIRPGFSYLPDTNLQDIAVFEEKWSSETNDGLLGKEIQPLDYVHVTGYPTLDLKFQQTPEEITKEFIEHTQLIIFAMSVTCISEKTYNKTLSTWLNTTICQRYKEVEKKNFATKK